MGAVSFSVIGLVLAALFGFYGYQAVSSTPFWLTDVMVLPLAGGLVIMALPDRYARMTKWIAAAFSLPAMLLCIGLALAFRIEGVGGFQFAEHASWTPALGISYSLAVDGIGMAMFLLTGIIIFTGCLASWGVEHRVREFYALLLLLTSGVFGVFAARDLFVFFMFYEVAVLPMYLLIGIWGTGPKEYSAMKLTLYLLLGSAFMLVGILALYFASGVTPLTFDMDTMLKTAYSPVFQKLFFPFLFLGFGILAGFWPLHTWSPDGHASAPTAVSMLHAGVLMKLGAFGIIRVGVEMLPVGAHAWLPVFAVFTVVNITYGALVAMAQTDLKYVIAYSSVSHMGIVVLGICTLTDAGLNGAVFQMFSHGIMTGLFFALVGFTYEKTHTRIIAEYGGLGRRMPVLATFFTIGGLASLGLPGLSGFVAEFMVFLGAWRFNPVLAVIAAAGIVFTAAYVLRVLQRCFWGPLNPHFADTPDAGRVEIICLTILAFFLILFGMYPRPLVSLINSGVVEVLARVGGG